MSGTQMSKEASTPVPSPATVDLKLEVVVIPVADVERAKGFYEGLGWRLDADFTNGKDWRGIQMTPPGSGCSIQFGMGLTKAAPGSSQGLWLIVEDIDAARAELGARGVNVSEPFHFDEFGGPPAPGVDPERRSYRSFASFSDPDGNGWLLQEIKTRLPGRGIALNLANLTDLLRESEDHHGEYEPTAPKHHWSGWYAAYVLARLEGKTPEEAAKDGKRNIEGAAR
jgi:catechol 2,3-dioxygenase-like lactoylglutathione lyase family enzyme